MGSRGWSGASGRDGVSIEAPAIKEADLPFVAEALFERFVAKGKIDRPHAVGAHDGFPAVGAEPG